MAYRLMIAPATTSPTSADVDAHVSPRLLQKVSASTSQWRTYTGIALQLLSRSLDSNWRSIRVVTNTYQRFCLLHDLHLQIAIRERAVKSNRDSVFRPACTGVRSRLRQGKGVGSPDEPTHGLAAGDDHSLTFTGQSYPSFTYRRWHPPN